MTIEIERPELEALIGAWMRTGAFESVEDALIEALRSSPLPTQPGGGLSHASSRGMGSDLVAAMQASPFKEISLDSPSTPMPVRDVML